MSIKINLIHQVTVCIMSCVIGGFLIGLSQINKYENYLNIIGIIFAVMPAFYFGFRFCYSNKIEIGIRMIRIFLIGILTFGFMIMGYAFAFFILASGANGTGLSGFPEVS